MVNFRFIAVPANGRRKRLITTSKEEIGEYENPLDVEFATPYILG